MTRDILEATSRMLDRQLRQFREAIDGIPDEDLNTWKPAAESSGGGPMNTFSALAVHITGAGTWRIFQQVYGDRVDRDREGEFQAISTVAEIDRMFNEWLTGFRERIERDVSSLLQDLASKRMVRL